MVKDIDLVKFKKLVILLKIRRKNMGIEEIVLKMQNIIKHKN